MDKQKRNAGITLIALVISIIVMLILAGVSINATVGDNGILKQALDASNKQKLAQEMESLNLELAKLNIDTITNNGADTIQNIVDYLISQGVIDEAVKTSTGAIAVGVDRETGSKYFFGKKGEHIYKISRGKDDILVAELSQSVTGGEITGSSSLVTADSFNNSSTNVEEKGKFNITSDSNVAFMDTISGELSIYVKAGVHASIEIYADMTLTNNGIQRSAIDIEPTGILDLYIAEGVKVTVNSGFGAMGADSSKSYTLGAPGGPGGYAGIHVPKYDEATVLYIYKKDENGNFIKDDVTGQYEIESSKTLPAGSAELNVYGSGTLIAIGGNAGSGGGTTTRAQGGAGGGGAGAGIGGNGGKGGNGNPIQYIDTLWIESWNEKTRSTYYMPGFDGKKGEDCGNVNFYDEVKIKAYGGTGGAGGVSTDSSGGGGGGYPRCTE